MSVVKSAKMPSRSFMLNGAVYLFLSTVALIGIILLYRSINEVVQRDVPPIGTLNFKLKSVERRFSGRMVWGNILEESPVYSGDVLRTGEDSAASAVLLTGDVIDLGENTLIQVFYDDRQGARLELQDGQLSLKTTGAALTLKAGGKEFKAGAGSAVTVRSTEGESVAMVAHEGAVEVEEDGVVQTIAAGQSYAETALPAGTGADAGVPAAMPPALSVTQPVSGAQVESLPGGVPFSWDSGAVEPGEPVRVEASRDPQFRVIAASNEVNGRAGGAALPLGDGDWWWRIYRPGREDGQAALSQGRLKVVPPPPQYDAAAAENLARPELLAAVKPEEPVYISRGTAQKLAQLNKEPPPPEFEAREEEGLRAPARLWPPAGHVFTAAYLRGRQTLSFFCGKVEGAQAYIWTFTQNGKVITRTTSEPACRFNGVNQFENGRLTWQVEAARREDGVLRHGEAAGSFVILTIPPARAPALKPPEKVTL
ncbi:MAG: FecR family protein [Spirochaetaceae bacterium]|nr:FecR family protein [Spirochaetaceae bacterium]